MVCAELRGIQEDLGVAMSAGGMRRSGEICLLLVGVRADREDLRGASVSKNPSFPKNLWGSSSAEPERVPGLLFFKKI